MPATSAGMTAEGQSIRSEDLQRGRAASQFMGPRKSDQARENRRLMACHITLAIKAKPEIGLAAGAGG